MVRFHVGIPSKTTLLWDAGVSTNNSKGLHIAGYRPDPRPVISIGYRGHVIGEGSSLRQRFRCSAPIDCPIRTLRQRAGNTRPVCRCSAPHRLPNRTLRQHTSGVRLRIDPIYDCPIERCTFLSVNTGFWGSRTHDKKTPLSRIGTPDPLSCQAAFVGHEFSRDFFESSTFSWHGPLFLDLGVVLACDQRVFGRNHLPSCDHFVRPKSPNLPPYGHFFSNDGGLHPLCDPDRKSSSGSYWFLLYCTCQILESLSETEI